MRIACGNGLASVHHDCFYLLGVAMMYLKALLFFPLSLIVKYFIAWPLTPIVVLFASGDGLLPRWLYWFSTPDNTLDGDQGWFMGTRPFASQDNRFKRYWNRCAWLWRNSAYGFAEQVMGITYRHGFRNGYGADVLITLGDPLTTNAPNGKSGFVRRYLVRDNKRIAFQWYYIRQWQRWPGKCIRVNIGWKLWSFNDLSVSGTSYVFSPWVWNTFKQ